MNRTTENLIVRATGETKPHIVAAIERVMRNEIVLAPLDRLDANTLSANAQQALRIIERRQSARFVCMEFHGRGDPFFGGNADDRILLTDGSFGHSSAGTPAARFMTMAEAAAEGRLASNRREAALISAIEMPYLEHERH